jgi:hypothetical protein
MGVTVKIHIERLTVEGTSRADAMRVGEALRVRLTELAAAGFVPSASNLDRVDAGELRHPATPEHIGRHTAGQIFQNIKAAPHA